MAPVVVTSPPLPQDRVARAVIEEFRKSAIPSRLTLANVTWASDDEAIELLLETPLQKLQVNTSYVTAPAARMIARYDFIRAGAWFAYGVSLDGSRGSVVYAKAFQPRMDFDASGKLKTIKYETPPKCDALPLLPYVDEETAQQIFKRYRVKPLEGESFWQTVQRCQNIPIGITEGLKKALSMTAHGLPTIALRGVTCWHKKQSAELHEAIAHFATSKRKVYIAFDQDTKPTTVRDVRRQLTKLGNTLELLECRVSVLMWPASDGKGIDDAIAGKREQGQEWFDGVVRSAIPFNSYKRDGRAALAAAIIAQLNQLTYPIERDTEGEYIPELPPLLKHAFHILTANMNSGKTHRIGKDWVGAAKGILKDAEANGWRVLVLSPLNGLGGQTANDWDFPHINDDKNPSKDINTRQLWELVKEKGGIVMCPDSLLKIPEWFWDEPVLLIMDECNQVIHHAAGGDTLKAKYEPVMLALAHAMNHAITTGAIVASEDGLPDRAIRFIQEVSGGHDAPVRVFRHRKQGEPWNSHVYTGHPSGYRARLLQTLADRLRHLIVTSSQREAERLERAIRRRYPLLKIVRIDSKTNQQGVFNGFFDAPDEWLQKHQPDVLILSPSAKSGVSIQGNTPIEGAYFSRVWGYFSALDTNTHMQMLGRFRPSVERIIFIPPFIQANSDEAIIHPWAVHRRMQRTARQIAYAHSLGELLDAPQERAEKLIQVEAAIQRYLADSRAITGAQKSIAHNALVKRLQDAGHNVTLCKSEKNQTTIELWKEIQEEIWRDEAVALAIATPKEDQDVKWALKTLESHEASLELRVVAEKVLLRDEFPGVDFNTPEECYQAICKDFGLMRRGVSLQARAENLDAAKEIDRKAAESILSGSIRALHRLPRSYAKALILAQTGILELLDGTTYNNSDPRAIAIKNNALRYASEIGYWLRLQIKPTQTPVEICNKLLVKIDIEKANGMLEVSRPGQRGQQGDRTYRVLVDANPTRIKLLEAARHKLSSTVSMIRNIDEFSNNQIVDTTLKPPCFEALPPDIGGEYRTAWQESKSDRDREAVRQAVEGLIAAFEEIAA